ncbi:MAG: translocation/assembly module TamB domain-containing protein, partial [Steroidobacteraceae bacterium]
CLFLLDSSVCGSGQWQRQGPWRVTATGDDVPLDILGEILADQPQYLGKMDVDLTAQGSPSIPWRGDASIVLTGGAVVYRLASDDAKTTETVQLGSGRADLRADAGSLSVAVGLSGAAESFIAATATVTRSPGVPFGNLPLTGRIRGRMGDANLLPVLVAEVDHAGGALVADVMLSGQVNSPQLDGRIELNRGELDLYRLNLALREMEVQLTLAANRLQFTGNGRAGDGTWNLGGALEWQQGMPVGSLQLKGDHLLVADLPEYRVVASPDLTFKIDPRSIRAEGEVFIPSARIQPRDLSGAVQISEDSRLLQEEPTARSGRYEVSSGIRVRLGDDVQLDTFGLQGRLGGSVNTLTRTGLIAIGRGELTVANGKYEAYGQKLDITRGRLLFDGTPLDDPGLDIQAERRIETTKVGLNVRGTLREPRFGFYSEPSMSQTQILSYMLVGKPLDDLQSRDTAAVGSARDSLALQGGGILAAQLGRRLGLEEVGVQTQGANQTALVLGKFLSPRLFVSYGISLTESINTLKLRYTITDRWVLKTEAGEHQSADVEFIIERP